MKDLVAITKLAKGIISGAYVMTASDIVDIMPIVVANAVTNKTQSLNNLSHRYPKVPGKEAVKLYSKGLFDDMMNKDTSAEKLFNQLVNDFVNIESGLSESVAQILINDTLNLSESVVL